MASALKNWRRKRADDPCFEEGDALYQRPDRKNEYFVIFISTVYVVFMWFAYYKDKGDWRLLLWDYWWLLPIALWYAIYRYRSGPSGEPLALVDTLTQTLTLLAPGNVWPRRFKAPLSMLRSVTIEPSTALGYIVSLEFIDGRRKNTIPFLYPYQIRVKLIDFLRRKLPPSIQFTVDNEAPYFGRGNM